MRIGKHGKTFRDCLRQKWRNRHIRFKCGKDWLQATHLTYGPPFDPCLGQGLHGRSAETAAFLPAYKIVSSPVGEAAQASHGAHASPVAGFLLGVTNPKAYLAFASLLASYTLIKGSIQQDTFTKWILLVAVMIVVDIVWLCVGVSLRGLTLSPNRERVLNVTLGLTVLIAAGLAFV
jgi:hypothetical protein